MKILFVRHAKAVEAADFDGADLLRPLTLDGCKAARKAFRVLARFQKKPEIIVCSTAVRARQTAEILAAELAVERLIESSNLNPGARLDGLKAVLDEIPCNTKRLAVVGHEPDLSLMISALVADGNLNIEIKKGACAEVEVARDTFKGNLGLLEPAGVLRDLAN